MSTAAPHPEQTPGFALRFASAMISRFQAGTKPEFSMRSLHGPLIHFFAVEMSSGLITPRECPQALTSAVAFGSSGVVQTATSTSSMGERKTTFTLVCSTSIRRKTFVPGSSGSSILRRTTPTARATVAETLQKRF
jgi:hypothetical protein